MHRRCWGIHGCKTTEQGGLARSPLAMADPVCMIIYTLYSAWGKLSSVEFDFRTKLFFLFNLAKDFCYLLVLQCGVGSVKPFKESWHMFLLWSSCCQSLIITLSSQWLLWQHHYFEKKCPISFLGCDYDMTIIRLLWLAAQQVCHKNNYGILLKLLCNCCCWNLLPSKFRSGSG